MLILAIDPAADRWREISFPADSGGVNAIIADPATAGRFYLARKEGGLWRSDDGGAAPPGAPPAAAGSLPLPHAVSANTAMTTVPAATRRHEDNERREETCDCGM